MTVPLTDGVPDMLPLDVTVTVDVREPVPVFVRVPLAEAVTVTLPVRLVEPLGAIEDDAVVDDDGVRVPLTLPDDDGDVLGQGHGTPKSATLALTSRFCVDWSIAPEGTTTRGTMGALVQLAGGRYDAPSGTAANTAFQMYATLHVLTETNVPVHRAVGLSHSPDGCTSAHTAAWMSLDVKAPQALYVWPAHVCGPAATEPTARLLTSHAT